MSNSYLVPRSVSGLPDNAVPQGAVFAGIRSEGAYMIVRYVDATQSLTTEPQGAQTLSRAYVDRWYYEGKEVAREVGELHEPVVQPKRWWWQRLLT
jgi:hypothetical protein